MDIFALCVLERPILVVVLMTGECKCDGVGLLDQVPDEVRLDIAVNAAVCNNNDHVCLCLHFGLILLVGFDDVGKIDAFPVCGDVPSGDVRVTEADDRDLHAVKVLDDVGIVTPPGRPILALVAVGRCVEVVCQADGELLLRRGRGGGRIVELAVEDVQTVVELMVADDPHIVADGTERLDRGIVSLRLVECVVVGQRGALDGVAHIDDVQVVAVECTLLLDVGGNTGKTTLVGTALRGVNGVVRREDLTVQVGGDKELEFGDNGVAAEVFSQLQDLCVGQTDLLEVLGGFLLEVGGLKVVNAERVLEALYDVGFEDGNILFAAELHAVVVLIGGHVVGVDLGILRAHEALEQSGDIARAILALGAVDKVRTLVLDHVAQTVCQTVLEGLLGEVNAEVQEHDILLGVIAFGIALVGGSLRRVVGEVDEGLDAGGFRCLVRVGVTTQLGVNRAGGAIQNVLAHAGGGDDAEVCKLLVGQVGIVLAVIGAVEVMEQVLRHVAARFLHLELDLDGEGHAFHCGPVPGLVRVGVLFGNAVGGGKVAHVDRHGDIAGGLAVSVLFDDDRGIAGVNIVVGRNDRQELYGDDVAPAEAQLLAEEVRSLAVGVDVAVFGHPKVGIKTADGDLVADDGRLLDGDTTLGCAVVVCLDDAAELFGDVVDHDGVQRIAGVELGACRCEGVVGIAAARDKVVGDNGILGGFVKCLAVDLVDGHTVNGLGSVVGGAGIGGFVLVVRFVGVNGELESRDLREAAERGRGAIGGGFKRFQQLCAGHIDDGDGVAEGQDGEDVVLRYVALLNGSTDAAAVGDGNDVVRVNLGDGAGILLGQAPDHCVGDEVAVVGLLGAVARLLGAVQIDLGGGELLTVLCFDGIKDALRLCKNSLVLLVEVALAGGNEEVLLDLLGGVVDHDHADVGKLRAGGLDGLIFLALFHDGMRMSVDDEIDSRDLGIQVIRAVRLGGLVHAEVGQADNDVRTLRLQRIDLRLRVLPNGELGGFGEEGQTLDERRIRLGLRLGSFQTEEADLHAALFDDGVRIKNGDTVCLENVGAENLKQSLVHVLLELRVAVVELMIAETDDIVAGGIHHFNGSRTLGKGDGGFALAEVAGIRQDDLGAGCFQLGFQRFHVGVAFDCAVNVIRVKNDGLAAADPIVFFRCKNHGQQGKYHADHQQEGQNAGKLLHDDSPLRIFHAETKPPLRMKIIALFLKNVHTENHFWRICQIATGFLDIIHKETRWKRQVSAQRRTRGRARRATSAGSFLWALFALLFAVYR